MVAFFPTFGEAFLSTGWLFNEGNLGELLVISEDGFLVWGFLSGDGLPTSLTFFTNGLGDDDFFSFDCCAVFGASLDNILVEDVLSSDVKLAGDAEVQQD